VGWLKKAQTIPPYADAPSTGGGGPVAGTAFQTLGLPEPLYPEPNFANNAERGFDKNELVYACIMEKATSLPDAPFRVFGPDGQGESREDHPLRRLMASPNPVTTEFEMLELTSIYMDLAGIAFWEIVKDRVDRPVELWPLRPDMVRIYPQRHGPTEYGYYIGQGRVVPLGTDVLAFKYPNPTNPALGQAPMRPANRAVALDNEATDFVKSLLQNRAVPGSVIETEQQINQDLVDRLTVKWEERFGGNNRGRPAFLQKGMKVHTLGLDLGALEFPDLRTISESRICMSFGVPPILIAAKVGLDRSTFANYAEARRSFWEETLMPLQKRMQQVIVTRLQPMVEGPRPRRSVAKFDNSEVLALRESEGQRWEQAIQAFRAGAITINEFCRRVGLPVKPGGDVVYLRPAGVVPTDVLGNPLVEQTTPAADSGTDGDSGAGEGAAAGDPQQAALPAAYAAKATPPPVDDEFADAIAAVVERQRASVLAQLEPVKTLLILSPHRFKGVRWDDRLWDKELSEAIEPHMRKAAHRAARAVDRNEPVEVLNGYVEKAARTTAEKWNRETRRSVDDAVVLGGEDVTGTVAAVFTLAAGVRAVRLARSSTTEMNGFAKVDTAKRVGLTNKTWVTGPNPRPEHAAMDGETVPVDQPFSIGTMWPSGPNCNCDVTFSSEGT
jgi:HK97 family phage portal protein